MSTFLYRLGGVAFRRRGVLVVLWLIALAVPIVGVAANGVQVSSELKIDNTQAQAVLDRVEQELPSASGGQVSAVFVASDGRLDDPAATEAVTSAIEEVYALDLVAEPASPQQGAGQQPGGPGDGAEGQSGSPSSAPVGPLMGPDGRPVPGVLVAEDGKVALFQFQTTVQPTSLTEDEITTIVDALKSVEDGTSIEALPSDSLKAFEPPVGVGEVIGVIVAAVVLVLTLGSLVAAGLPLLTALFGVGIGVGGAYALSEFITMNSATPVLGLMIGLAVGIDYALFIVNRQRRLILDHQLTAEEAAARAVGTAGSAVFFAGMTVVIALASLSIIGISFLTVMALVAATTVILAVLIALTLLPALLGFVGERVVSRRARERRAGRGEEAHGVAHRFVRPVVAGRWLVSFGVVGLLVLAAVPVLDIRLGIPTGATANTDTDARKSYEAISTSFGEGFNGPLLVTVEPSGSAPLDAERAAALIGDLSAQDDIATVAPVGATPDGQFQVLSVIPESGPDETATTDLVRDLRSPDSAVASTNDVTLGVTGLTAINIDMSEKLSDALPLYLALIIVLSMVVLTLVFRSLVVPVMATLGFVLSILATFGATTAVFQWGWGKELFGFDTGGPLVSFMPIMVTGILYGLAMDYQVFLVSSMREAYVHGRHGRDAVIYGFDQASRVVVAAAIIMIAVFSGFIFSHDVMIKQIGFALAIGVLIDAFVVRVTLIPAAMAVFGDRAWWLPRWLDRLLPDLDVEGDKLADRLHVESGQTAEAADTSVSAGVSPRAGKDSRD
ncbi:MMPL family transporter [Nocardioides coralli]|nr:MMPL family transporter [Nocardioides coralli]